MLYALKQKLRMSLGGFPDLQLVQMTRSHYGIRPPIQELRGVIHEDIRVDVLER